MTSVVQMAGRPVRMAGGSARASGRGGTDGTSFADMVSSNLSPQKDAPSAQPKAGRTDAQGGRDATVQKKEPVPEGREPVKAEKPVKAEEPGEVTEAAKPEEGEVSAEEETGADLGGDTPKAEELKNPEDGQTEDAAGGVDLPEDVTLDLQFPKSLKLFKEAARFLEAQKLNELKQAVMDSLNIDEEELEEILAQLGVNMQALLQPQILQQVVAEVKGDGDMAVFLTDESAADSLKELTETAKRLAAEVQTEMDAVELPEMAELSAAVELPEEEAVSQTGTKAEEPEFLEILAKDMGGSERTAEEAATKLPVEEEAPATARADVKGDVDFSFEAVKETTVQAAGEGQEPSQGRSGRDDARTEKGSMAEQFLDLVAKAAPRDEAEFAALPRSEQVREVAQQIIERVRVFVGEAQSSMEISLTPESLGRVTLNLISRHGALTAHFTAQNQIAKEAIESQIVVLRENLESQGLKVEAIEVTVSNFDFTKDGSAPDSGGQGGRNRGRRGVTLDEAAKAEGADSAREAEELAADMMERNGNQVDYTA